MHDFFIWFYMIYIWQCNVSMENHHVWKVNHSNREWSIDFIGFSVDMGLTYRHANSYHSGKDSKRETFENSWGMGRWIHGSPVIEGTMSYNLSIYHISCISPCMYIYNIIYLHIHVYIYIMYISWLCKTCSSSSWNNQSTSELGMSKTVSLRCRQTFVGPQNECS